MTQYTISIPYHEVKLGCTKKKERGIKTSFMDLSLVYNRAVNKRFIKDDNTDDNGM